MTTAGYRLQLPARDTSDPDPRIAAVLAKAQANLGRIPNMYAYLGNVPGMLETYLFGYSAFRSDSGFDRAEQEVVLLSISRANGCEYCVAAHSTIADLAGVPAAIVDALREAKPLPDPRLDVLATFTRVVVETRGLPAPSDAEPFLAAGYTDEQILNIILAIAVKTISNYGNHLFHTQVDAMFAERAWTEPRQ